MEKKKCSRNHYKNHVDFSSNFLSILAPFWTPRETQKLIIFHLSLLLVSPLGHRGAKRAPKELQDRSRRRRIWYHFGVDFWRISEIFNLLFNIISYTQFEISIYGLIDISSCSWCRSWAILAPRGCTKCSRADPEVNFPRIWYHFGVDFGRFFYDFRIYFNTTSRLISHSMLPFLQY